jgi:hypothetical protein
MNRALALGFLLFTTALFVRAQVRITEIMYDPAGSDTGREWIEVQNISGGPIDFTTWKFFEANVNHGIDQIDGYAAELAANEYGVVVSDKAKFLVDFPSFSGKIFKSSFSLSNTGEVLAFKNDAGVVSVEYLYDVALGGAGDGNSLQKSTAWIATVPSPGAATTGSGGTSGATTTSSGGETTINGTGPALSGSGSTYGAAELFGTITTPQIAFAGAETTLKAQAFVSGGKTALNPFFTWNFGDGTVGYGSVTTHRYKYPGTYHVVLDVVASADGITAFASEHAPLTVVALDIFLSEGSDEQGGTYIRIENKSKYLTDLSFWLLQKGGGENGYYVFPKNTFIAPFAPLRIPQEVTRFKNDSDANITELLFPNKVVIARYDPGRAATANIASAPATSTTVLKTYVANTVQSNPKIATKMASVSPPVRSQKVVQASTTQKIAQTEASSTSELPLIAAITTSGEKSTSVLWYVLPLLVIMVVAGAFLGTKKESALADEYTIIDDGK